MSDIVNIYTDGASSGNPGPGGYGVVLLFKGHRKELSGGFRITTNNRMELIAVIEGLKALKRKCKVIIHSDSKYIVESIQKGWIYDWQKKNWKRKRNKPVLNADLWKELYELINEHETQFKWVQGHNGNKENERCDEIAVKVYDQPDLPPDINYENQTTSFIMN